MHFLSALKYNKKTAKATSLTGNVKPPVQYYDEVTWH